MVTESPYELGAFVGTVVPKTTSTSTIHVGSDSINLVVNLGGIKLVLQLILYYNIIKGFLAECFIVLTTHR